MKNGDRLALGAIAGLALLGVAARRRGATNREPLYYNIRWSGRADCQVDVVDQVDQYTYWWDEGDPLPTEEEIEAAYQRDLERGSVDLEELWRDCSRYGAVRKDSIGVSAEPDFRIRTLVSGRRLPVLDEEDDDAW